MRRRGLLLFAVMIPLSVALGTGAANALDRSVVVPGHQDPVSAPASLDLVPLFTFAEQMLSEILHANTPGLSELRRTILSANLPTPLRPLMQKLTSVSLEFRAVIARLDVVLPAAEESIRRRHIQVARSQLAEARILVRQGQGLLDELDVGTDRMIELVATYRRFQPRMPGLLPDLQEQVQEYWQRYLRWLRRLQEEVQSIEEELQSGQRSLVETALTVDPESDRVTVGGELVVSGLLVAEEQGIPGRVIEIHLGQALAGTAVTDDDGGFHGSLSVPFVYTPRIRLEAWFTPDDVDRRVYLGSSAAMELALVYLPTDFTVEAPPVARPGRLLPITVAMAADATPADGRNLSVTLLGRTMVETRCPGRCVVEAQVPPDAPLGHQTITVSIPASGLYAGASKNMDVTVALIPTSLSLTVPGLALAPGAMEVSGTIAVAEGTPGPGAIHIRLGDTLQRVEPLGSAFRGRLDLPLWPPVSGLRGLEVSYHPVDPWLGASGGTANILIVHPGSAGMLVLAGVAIGSIALRRRRVERHPREREGLSAGTPDVRGLVSPQPLAVPVLGVREAYQRTLRLLERLWGARTKASLTMREVLALVQERLPVVAHLFRRLTLLAEEARYSRRTPTTDQAQEAMALAQEMEERSDRG